MRIAPCARSCRSVATIPTAAANSAIGTRTDGAIPSPCGRERNTHTEHPHREQSTRRERTSRIFDLTDAAGAHVEDLGPVFDLTESTARRPMGRAANRPSTRARDNPKISSTPPWHAVCLTPPHDRASSGIARNDLPHHAPLLGKKTLPAAVPRDERHLSLRPRDRGAALQRAGSRVLRAIQSLPPGRHGPGRLSPLIRAVPGFPRRARNELLPRQVRGLL